MKVHITLKDSLRNDPEAKEAALRDLESSAGIRAINRKRFERYGVISAEIDADKLAVARQSAAVKAIEADEPKYASTESSA